MKTINYAVTIIFRLFAIIFVALGTGCSHHLPQVGYLDSPLQKSYHHTMIVLVHGTILPILCPSAFGSSLHQSLARGRRLNKSWYQLYLDALQTKSIYCYQPSGPDGLHLVTTQPSACIATAMYHDLMKPKTCSCYTFGWHGRLSSHKRRHVAHQLYHQLRTEIDRLQQIHTHLDVIMICHSHGGNVALNLAHAEETYKQQLRITKLILLGTPIQSETAHYAAAPCFEKIYNFYSHGDCIQKIDMISTRDNGSGRTFSPHDNLTQIEITCGKKKPGHTELWLFGGKDNWLYRETLSISPFPLFVFLPTIIQQLDAMHPKTPHVRLNIEKNQQRLRFRFSDNKRCSVTSLPETFLKKYRNTILGF